MPLDEVVTAITFSRNTEFTMPLKRSVYHIMGPIMQKCYIHRGGGGGFGGYSIDSIPPPPPPPPTKLIINICQHCWLSLFKERNSQSQEEKDLSQHGLLCRNLYLSGGGGGGLGGYSIEQYPLPRDKRN